MLHISKKVFLGTVISIAFLCVMSVFWFVWQSATPGATSTRGSIGVNASMNQYEATDMAMGEESAGLALRAPTISPSPDMDGSVVAPETTERLIIRNGNFSIVVDDVRDTVRRIHAMTETAGGFIVSSDINEYEPQAPSAHVSVRVPADSFDQSVADLRSIGDVEHESITGRDVTEAYVDMQAQLGNLEATETQFLEIMTRATEIADVLAVQRELSNVRRQIEQIEGRMQYLEESASYSLITISLATDPKELPFVEEGTWKPLAEIKQAIRSLLAFGQGIVSALIWLAIYAPVWIILLLVVRYVYRKYLRT